jgi:hypothetical protein
MNTLVPRSSSRAGKFRGLITLALLSFPMAAVAEPYMAVRTGFKCSQCHLNQSGGAGRTEYGQAYTQYQLLMKQTQEAILGGREGALTSFDPKLNDAITIGGNFRTEQFVKQESGTEPADNVHAVSESNVYFNVELVKNFLSFYVDQNMGSGSNREIWMMARKLPLNSYIKVGRTLLPYGLRLMDDQAYIRSKTNYTYGRHDLAGEIGLEPGPFSVIANLTNNHFSSVGSVVFRRFRVGGSYGTVTDGSKFDTYGGFAGASFGKWTMLGEVDFIEKAAADSTIQQMAHLYEVNFLPMQGLNLKTTYEYFDNNTSIANRRDGQDRWTFGVEHFPIQFLQIGAYYRINRGNPKNDPNNQDMLITRAHVFF